MMDPMSLLLDVQERIDMYGWAVQGVIHTHGSSFAYTVGLTKFDHPEIIVYLPDHRTAQALLNDLGERVRAGRTFRHREVLDDLVRGYDAMLVAVDEAPVNIARLLYDEENVTVLQLLLPDARGRFPTEVSMEWQPLLPIKPEEK